MEELFEEINIISKKIRLVHKYSSEINDKEKEIDLEIERIKNQIKGDRENLIEEINSIKNEIKDINSKIFLIGNYLNFLVEKEKIEKIKKDLKSVDFSKLEPI